MTRYRTIAADPPWLERGGGKSKRGADQHYPLMKTYDIIDTMADALGMAEQLNFLSGEKTWHHDSSDVADSAHLWLWVTDNFLPDGLRVMDALGFRYVRTLVWVKARQTEYAAVLQAGLGQYLRGAHELCLFGTRGDANVPPPECRDPSVVIAERTKHSVKPWEAYDRMCRTSSSPRLEMFARGPRDGWDVWGNQADGSDL